MEKLIGGLIAEEGRGNQTTSDGKVSFSVETVFGPTYLGGKLEELESKKFTNICNLGPQKCSLVVVSAQEEDPIKIAQFLGSSGSQTQPLRPQNSLRASNC